MIDNICLYGVEGIGRIRESARGKFCFELPQKGIPSSFVIEVERYAAIVVW